MSQPLISLLLVDLRGLDFLLSLAALVLKLVDLRFVLLLRSISISDYVLVLFLQRLDLQLKLVGLLANLLLPRVQLGPLLLLSLMRLFLPAQQFFKLLYLRQQIALN